jgi:hypothetical protein
MFSVCRQVVQVYIAWRDCRVVMPQLQLVAVRRLTLRSTHKKTVSLVIKNDQLRIYDDAQGFILYPGLCFSASVYADFPSFISFNDVSH